MFTRRFLLALMASTLLLPLSGCGCRRQCCNSSSSFAPPPAPCCPDRGAPSGYLPSVTP